MSPLSIYVHWPFCLSLCPYCDFNSHIINSVDAEKWPKGYEQELEYFASRIKGRKVRSIFFGGGTPSLMDPLIVSGVIKKIAELGIVSDETEITLEANPTSYDAKNFEAFRGAGVNRVSIGVQSFRDDGLKLLGRKHSADEAIKVIKSAASLFERYSFDLIYAIPGQSQDQWQDDLKYALELAGGHISLYQLTIEKGTPFYSLFHQGKLDMPADDIAANMYEWTNSYLQKNGYERYEISNYAKPGQECMHNLCYWDYDEYIGIGPGAHSRLHDGTCVRAVMMTHKPEKWLAQTELRGVGIQSESVLSDSEILEEFVMMGTRLAGGLRASKAKVLLGKDLHEFLDMKLVQKYAQEGLLEFDDKFLRLTDRGLMLHNYLVPRIIRG